MKIEVVTIGDELLLGFTIDTNAAFLARSLASIGVEIIRRTTCGDTAAEIADAVRTALDRTGAVITTGGLGPTADDITKASIAALFGRAMHRDESVAEGLREMWRSRKRPGELPEANYVQAMIPDGARILPNAHGTAPGIWLDDASGRWVAMLPGVPREMRGMFVDALLPIIAERVQAQSPGAPVIASRTLRTTGIAESVLAEQLGELAKGFDGMSLAFLPGIDGVDLRLTIRGKSAPASANILDAGAGRIRAILGDAIYGQDGEQLPSLVAELCRRAGVRIAVAESCTGGLLGARLTAIPGSSDIFQGGVIAYDNQVKREQLGVSEAVLAEHGAVSEPVALAMARAVRTKLGTEIGISITGIAGPGGGSPEKPVGTVWIAVDVDPGNSPRESGPVPLRPSVQVRGLLYVGDREEIRHRATQSALALVRRALSIDLV